VRDRARDPAGGGRLRTLAAAVLAAAVGFAAPGCEEDAEGPELPARADIEGIYGDRAEVTLNGNVVDVRARQDANQLERGGSIWARVGPYIYLFSPQTQEIFEQWPGVAAVRVRTVTDGGGWVAEATLRRDALNAITWKDARRRVTRAREQGTDKPGYMEDLVDYGEDRTDHRYNPEYVDGGG
jgi:hypothetical protein